MAETLPKTLLIPVETTNREFDGKLLLALKALQRGYEPILGSRTEMHAILPRFPQSIYVAKGARSGSERVFRLLEALGHVIVAFDEEALVRFPDEAFHMKLDPATFNRPRLLYAWGKSNADVWRSFKDYRGAPILEVGNPRVDMMRPEIRDFYGDDCAQIRSEIGRYVMISSNFAFVNHFIPNHVRHRVVKTADKAKANAVKSGFGRHKQELFEHFLALVPKLAQAITPHTLLVRPHPSENASAWEEAASGLSNVKVIHRGPITPWLMAADALVHNGCTSGIEASILGTPAIAFRPVTSSFDLELPNSVSVAITDGSQLVSSCKAILNTPYHAGIGPSPEQVAILAKHIASLEGPLTCDRILDSLETHSKFLSIKPATATPERIKVMFLHAAREAYRIAATRLKNNKSSAAYSKHKFPDMTLAQVKIKAQKLAERLSVAIPHIQQISTNIFSLRRQQPNDVQ